MECTIKKNATSQATLGTVGDIALAGPFQVHLNLSVITICPDLYLRYLSHLELKHELRILKKKTLPMTAFGKNAKFPEVCTVL